MPGGVPKYRVSAHEERPSSLGFAFDHGRVAKGPSGAKRLVHQVDADDVIREPSQLSRSNLDRFHGCEHAQLVLADQKLRARDLLNEEVKRSALETFSRVERVRPLGGNPV